MRRNSNVVRFEETVLPMPSIRPPFAVVQCSSTLPWRQEPAIQSGRSAAKAGVARARRRRSVFMGE